MSTPADQMNATDVGLTTLAPITITATPLPPIAAASFSLSDLLKPPKVYFVGAAAIAAIWLLTSKKKRGRR